MKKIAIPVNDDNQLEDHFGQCDYYAIYSVSNENEIIDVKILQSTKGCGCKSNIANVLVENGVGVMLAGGIGAGAINVLNNCNIDVIRGCSGTPDTLVKQYLNGEILDSGVSCSQHEHDHNHQCSH